jgi:cleavage and polyadenylation specificity factor subunit 4
MPPCRHGERCKIKDHPFGTLVKLNRMECVFYTQGFAFIIRFVGT